MHFLTNNLVNYLPKGLIQHNWHFLPLKLVSQCIDPYPNKAPDIRISQSVSVYTTTLKHLQCMPVKRSSVHHYKDNASNPSLLLLVPKPYFLGASNQYILNNKHLNTASRGCCARKLKSLIAHLLKEMNQTISAITLWRSFYKERYTSIQLHDQTEQMHPSWPLLE